MFHTFKDDRVRFEFVTGVSTLTIGRGDIFLSNDIRGVLPRLVYLTYLSLVLDPDISYLGPYSDLLGFTKEDIAKYYNDHLQDWAKQRSITGNELLEVGLFAKILVNHLTLLCSLIFITEFGGVV